MRIKTQQPFYAYICKKYSKAERDDMFRNYEELEAAYSKFKDAFDIYEAAMQSGDKQQIDEAEHAKEEAMSNWSSMSEKLWDDYGPEKHFAMVVLGEYIRAYGTE